ncbi:MAG TPA: phosphoribosyltransferase family protein, partial [Acidobacteriaceae bacterium]|nr:phosphoribosyltransferase family protein [Acidobacteriaceae bacterium]
LWSGDRWNVSGAALRFADRSDAGRQLAEQLRAYADDDVLVLGIPRGGVPVAYEVASALHAPLDVFLSRKLGVPGNEELAFGAVAAGDGRFLDEQIIHAARISPEQVEQITHETRRTLDDRARLFRRDRPPLSVAGRTVILIDDGIATGSSIYAAVRALREIKPRKLVIAVPVVPRSTQQRLAREVDDFVAVYAPDDFYAVGQFYRDFRQTTDEEVIDLLARSTASQEPIASGSHELSIPMGAMSLQGILTIPESPKGIVIFAHGSGSSRNSPRNRYVADVLNHRGVATLLFDLLTAEEETLDQSTGALRFDIHLLSERLVEVTNWVRTLEGLERLPLGYFGASTGAAASLMAADQLADEVRAIVSRGGRPDLAGDSLQRVHAPTLLIVGGSDTHVLTLNQQALARLASQDKRLAVVPGATHLFEERGALEQVAQLAADWFTQHLTGRVSAQS